MNNVEFFAALTAEIQAAYEESVTMDKAERLAGRFLHGMILATDEIRVVDLDARMRKSGVKAIRAAVYLEEVRKNEKKPSDVLLDALVNSSREVQAAQDALDNAEVLRDQLQNYYNIFNQAHVFFRQTSKASFAG